MQAKQNWFLQEKYEIWPEKGQQWLKFLKFKLQSIKGSWVTEEVRALSLVAEQSDVLQGAGVRVSGQGFRHQAGRCAAIKNTLPLRSYCTPAVWRTFQWTHSTDQGSGCGNQMALLTECTVGCGHDSLLNGDVCHVYLSSVVLCLLRAASHLTPFPATWNWFHSGSLI